MKTKAFLPEYVFKMSDIFQQAALHIGSRKL